MLVGFKLLVNGIYVSPAILWQVEVYLPSFQWRPEQLPYRKKGLAVVTA